jgi:cyclopropane-fatty-acyl-phospholipid synthase
MSDIAASLPRSTDRRARQALHLAGLIRAGQLELTLPDGEVHRFHGVRPGPTATLHLRDHRMVRRLALGGSLGLAESYLEGEWHSPDIRAVMALAAANEAELFQLLRGRPVLRWFTRLMHRLNRNSRRGARRNVAAHYDLGNDFYQLWLDRSLTYSAAMFAGPHDTLEAAQARKVRHLLDMLDLRPGQTLLEIGCGWGFLAELAARERGVRVVAITLSQAQAEAARARVAAAGLSDRIEIRLQDYRDVSGTFDAITSVEMIEAVGMRWWPAYFQMLHARLRAGGAAALQAIIIPDRTYAEYLGTADFIQRYVFPGGMLPSPGRIDSHAAAAGLVRERVRWFGQDYAETLARWQARFQAAWPRIRALPAARPYDARFKRLWEYYLAYCETGFRVGWTEVGQILLRRPA